MKETVIEVHDLKKTYGAVTAVNGISFSICKGQLAALLGPNGAGKSTAIGIISTAVKKYEGKVYLLGADININKRKTRKNIGIVFQNGVLDEQLTVMENLRVRANFYGIRGKKLGHRIEETAELTGISLLLKRFYGSLSGGQKRRCDIARALIHSPKILLLDEPTAGLDPDMRGTIWETVDVIRQRTGMTVMMTTHYMEEAQHADKIMIMKNGNMVFDGTPIMLRERFGKDELILYSGNKMKRISLSDTTDALIILNNKNGCYDSFEVIKGSIDTAYMSVVGSGSQDER